MEVEGWENTLPMEAGGHSGWVLEAETGTEPT